MGCTVTLLPSSPLSFLFIPPGSLRFLGVTDHHQNHTENLCFLVLSLSSWKPIYLFSTPTSSFVTPTSSFVKNYPPPLKGPQTSSDFLSILKNLFIPKYETLCEETPRMFISDFNVCFSFFSFFLISVNTEITSVKNLVGQSLCFVV